MIMMRPEGYTQVGAEDANKKNGIYLMMMDIVEIVTNG
jgi:hypothetical protein